MTAALLDRLAQRKGQLALDAADAVCLLVERAAELGELRTANDDGSRGPIDAGRLARWISRLDRAVEVGAFERKDVSDIVDRILSTEPEAKPTNV